MSHKDVERVIKKTLNWKSSGRDKIQKFWYKQFKSTLEHLTKYYTSIVERPELTPNFMSSGISYLQPKTAQYTENPEKYRSNNMPTYNLQDTPSFPKKYTVT